MAQLTHFIHAVVLSTFAECEQKIKKLTDKLFDLDLEDYGLDKTTNFDAKTPDGQRNLRVSDVLIGVLEAALEHEFLIHGDTLTSCQIILTLFKKRKELMALHDGAAKERGKKTKTKNRVILAISVFFCFIFFLYSRHCPPFLLRVLGFSRTVHPPIAMHTRDIEHRCVLAKVYLHILIEETSDSTLINHQPKKGNSILCAVATNLHQILTTTEQGWPDEFSMVLMHMLTVSPQPQPTNSTTNCLMMTLLRDFKEIVDKYLNAQPPLYKEATVVLQTISWLTSKLDSSEEQYEDDASTVTRWMVRIMEDRPIQEVAVAREVLSLLMTQCTRQDQMDVLKNITNDIHMIYGDIDVQQFDSQAAITTTYTLINEKTIQPMAAQILTLVEDAIVDMIWCIGRLKMCDEEAKRPAFELATIERMDAYVEMVNELTRAGFMGALAEQMIRTLTKMYRTLMALMKYKLTKPKDIPPEFIHIVAKIGNSLTDNMYRYLTSYTSQRKEEYERASSNARKKAKGKGKRNQVDEREKVSNSFIPCSISLVLGPWMHPMLTNFLVFSKLLEKDYARKQGHSDVDLLRGAI
ncbi:FANCI solenoid 4-domain-containing protein [Gongronella butleri]|nr:FANCI solenoid 4-domain-containing protein [Gongronella butleri]